MVVDTLGPRVNMLFDDSIVRVQQHHGHVEVGFQNHPPETFDLVIGADGLHSRVRDLAFGPAPRFERYLGIKVAAFTTEGYQPRDELVYVMFSRVGRHVSRFSMRNNRTMFLFTFGDADPHCPASVGDQKRVLKDTFGDDGWECPRILRALDAAEDLYFDRVSQIDMAESPTGWSVGRVALVGDAAFCVSLLGGEGSSLAMTASYVLAGELARAGGAYDAAFRAYEHRLLPLIRHKQRAARRFAGTFAPTSSMSLFVRNHALQLLSIPTIAKLALALAFDDDIALPVY
jgi:2-polyprenyl-6-methoxyphenol hydroxylase-like FAD-dependent oxidoreductase